MEDGIFVFGFFNGGSRVGCVGRSVVGGVISVVFIKFFVVFYDLGEIRMYGEKYKFFYGELY